MPQCIDSRLIISIVEAKYYTINSFCAVNEERFSANGKGKLVVDVPGGVNYSQLHLIEVLHPPEVGFTPVSISRRDEEGSSVMQDGGKCIV